MGSFFLGGFFLGGVLTFPVLAEDPAAEALTVGTHVVVPPFLVTQSVAPAVAPAATQPAIQPAIQPAGHATSAMDELNATFASAVIIPTYASLVSQTQALVEAAVAFEADPSELTLYSLRSAWLSSASAWAEGTAFAFGPVHSLGHGTALEFPVDPLGIEALMADEGLAAGPSQSGDGKAGDEYSEWDEQALLPSVQGFEAIAYLLYGPNGDKSLGDFSARERRYLTWLARGTRRVSGDLLTVWQLGIDEHPAYEAVLASAGEPGNGAYLSPESGTEEIVRGLINCLEVVSHEGLPEMLAAPQVLSQGAGARSLALLNSTLKGVQTAYLGVAAAELVVDSAAEPVVETSVVLPVALEEMTAKGDRTGGLSDWVSVANANTDAQIQQSLAAAAESVAQAMANPRDVAAVSDSLAMAQSSLAMTQTLLETDVLPLLQQ